MFAQCFCKKPSKVSLQKILYISLQSIFFDVATQHQKKYVFWWPMATKKQLIRIYLGIKPANHTCPQTALFVTHQPQPKATKKAAITAPKTSVIPNDALIHCAINGYCQKNKENPTLFAHVFPIIGVN